ncbi:MAG: hypothetical protein L0G27_00545 [Paracoccus sp. (in: a-proteobacteria)]|nr:hypothetical protein [Paracoccus sp. (in: a-proteobacteria)]
MYAPEGYVPFADVRISIEHLAHSAIIRISGASLAHESAVRSVTEDMVSAGMISNRGSSSFARELVEVFLLAKLLEAYPPALCSPSGTIMQIRDDFFVHGDRLDWFYLSFPIDKMSELSNYFLYNKINNFDGKSIRQRYCFIDAEYGLVKLKNNSISLYDSCSHYDGNPSDELAALAKKFSGWALCWKEGELPTHIELVELVFPDLENKWKWSDFFTGDGVSKKTASATILEELLQAYPNGKTDTWPITEKKVGYARRSIERALAETGRKDWKDMAGQK